MTKLLSLLLAVVLIAGLLALESAGPAVAQEKPAAAPDDEQPPLPIGDSGELPAELQDAAFERYVDLQQLG